jgi:anaerobic magnesium-protoporphyrin IX monomethyl ester cyclase
MKILVLEHPRRPSRDHFNDIAHTPLWSCLMGGYAAAALAAAGHKVDYRDATGPEWDFSRLTSTVKSASPDLLCLHAVYFWEQTGALFDWIAGLTSEGFAGHLNLFGFYPSLAHARLAGLPGVDSVVIGECEATLVALAAALQRGGKDLRMPGLVTAATAAAPVWRPPIEDLESLPTPWRSTPLPETPSVLASRGCPHHCSFCLVPPFYNRGPLWRGRQPGAVAAEVRALTTAGARDIYFADPNFVGPGRAGQERALALAALLAPLEVTFGMETRAGDLTPGLLRALTRAGLTSLLLGLESGSARLLGRIGKAQPRETGAAALRLCRAAGLEPEVGFIMFLADSRLEDLQANIDFLTACGLLDRLDRTANLLGHRQIVLAGTTGYRRLEACGRLAPAGFGGFEGRVAFSDHRVAWLQEAVLGACHQVLASMSDPQAPIFWQAPAGPVHARVNRALVALFKELLAAAAVVAPGASGAKAGARAATVMAQALADADRGGAPPSRNPACRPASGTSILKGWQG